MTQQSLCGAKIIFTRINLCQPSERVSMAPCLLLWVGPGSFVPAPCDSFELSYNPHFGALVYRTLKTKFCCQIKRQNSCYLIFLPPASFLLFLPSVPPLYHPALTLAGFLESAEIFFTALSVFVPVDKRILSIRQHQEKTGENNKHSTFVNMLSLLLQTPCC